MTLGWKLEEALPMFFHLRGTTYQANTDRSWHAQADCRAAGRWFGLRAVVLSPLRTTLRPRLSSMRGTDMKREIALIYVVVPTAHITSRRNS